MELSLLGRTSCSSGFGRSSVGKVGCFYPKAFSQCCDDFLRMRFCSRTWSREGTFGRCQRWNLSIEGVQDSLVTSQWGHPTSDVTPHPGLGLQSPEPAQTLPGASAAQSIPWNSLFPGNLPSIPRPACPFPGGMRLEYTACGLLLLI